MSMPYDATIKAMLERSPGDWLALAGLPPAPATVIDADVSTVTAGADKVVQVTGEPDYLFHLEFQSGWDESLPGRMLLYNALLTARHNHLVRSVAILLRPEANAANLTGILERRHGEESPYLTFCYQVIRVWQLPARGLLEGGLGTLPLAPISAVTEADLPGVLSRMRERLRSQGERAAVKDLWAATYILMGLRFDQALVNRLLQEVMTMEDSVTYQAIVARGRSEGIAEGTIQGLRRAILALGEHKFGPARGAVRTALEEIHDAAQLEHLSVRLLNVNSWEELLGLPPRPARRRRRS
jgi:predicted transposase YdaD